MKILLLTDREGAKNAISDILKKLLEQAGHEIQAITLSREELKPCLGCFGCWLKTPGQCVITDDDENNICLEMIQSDAVVLLTRLTYGGFSADTKAFLDRSIQNIQPFFEIHKGEMHHLERYERFPAWIAVGYGRATEPEKQTFLSLKERHVLNMRPRKHLALTIKDGSELSFEAEKIIELLREANA